MGTFGTAPIWTHFGRTGLLQDSAVWPGGGGVEDVLLGVEKGGVRSSWCPASLGADRKGRVFKGVLFFVAAETGVFDGVGAAVRKLECGQFCVHPRDCF